MYSQAIEFRSNITLGGRLELTLIDPVLAAGFVLSPPAVTEAAPPVLPAPFAASPLMGNYAEVRHTSAYFIVALFTLFYNAEAQPK